MENVPEKTIIKLLIQNKNMNNKTALDIITALLNGWHLEPKELERAKRVIKYLQIEIENRK